VAGGESLFIVGKVLGHRQASTTERYAHLAPDPAKAVAERTAERIAGLLGAKRGAAAGNVVAYPGARTGDDPSHHDEPALAVGHQLSLDSMWCRGCRRDRATAQNPGSAPGSRHPKVAPVGGADDRDTQ
jgi:hypothetical protein